MSKIITLDGLRDYLTNLKRLFVTKTDAESTYETKANAANIYETKEDAATHLSKSDAAGTYLSKTDAASTCVQTGAVDQTIAGTKTFSKPIVGSVTGSSGSCTGNAATANIATKADSATKAANADHATKADSATNATYANWLRTSSHTDHLFHTEWDKAGYFWTYVTTGSGEYRAVRVARSDSSGNADTATKLATARTIALSGAATGKATGFDGSGNITIPVTSLDASKLTGTASVSTTGNAASANIATKATQDAAGNTITTTYATKAENNIKANNSEVVHKSGDETIAGTKTFSKPIVGSVTGSSGSCTGNAATATQFSANATVALTGDATGTSAGSKKGWSVPVTLANSGVTAGTYGPSADVTGNNNATISVPEITVDAKGRVTSVTNRTLTCKNNTYNVYNKTLTIQKNGTNVATFTSNSNTNVTANITVPTKVSELTNDSGFLTSHQSLSNYVTLNGAQTISGAKTFTGDVIGINKDSSTEDANSLYSTTAGSKLTYYTTTGGRTTLTNVPAVVNTTLESRTLRRLSDSDWVVEQICHNNNGLYYRKGINGTWGAWKTFAFTDSNISGNAATATTATTAKACTGNAATATQFSANATVALTGDATGTSAGSKKGWSVPVTLANSGVTAGTYGPSANVTGNNNATISVPQITVDAKGRVTSVTNRTLTCKNNTYSVYNKTLTIQKNGTNVATFTSNSNTDVTANITVPTKTSELTNDSGYLTSHQSLSNYVTLNGAQTISGNKTFTGTLTGTLTGNCSGTSGGLLTNTTFANRSFTYTEGQVAIGTTAGKAFKGSSNNAALVSFPENGTAFNDTSANIQNLRLTWHSDGKYLHDLFTSPNSIYFWHRDVHNASARPWRRIVEENTTDVTPPTWNISIGGNAATATKATGNANGKELTNTIIKGLSISGKTITYTQIDGSTGTLTTQDTNTDTLMTQNVSTTNATYPILLCPTANATANQGAKTSIFASGVKVNPSTSTITATTFSGALTGNVTGNVSGSSGSCTGNAATATKLAAKRTIALSGAATGTATAFDGSGNITIPVTSLDASKLTGTASVSTTGNAATATTATTAKACTGNAATATKLATARSLWGNNFDGSAAITGAITGTPAIELMPAAKSNHGGFLDFHYNHSTADYTSRIIESASGTLSINNVTITTGKVVTATTFNGALKGNVTGNCSGSSGSCTGNAASANIATKATQDAAGNTITTTYATKAENNTKANNSEVVHKSGDETIAGTKTFSNGVLLTNVNALMVQNGEYTLVLRHDSRNTYLLMSDKGGDPGTWSDARPLVINNSTGVCSINGNADSATKAANADHATSADSATRATNADHATYAQRSANNAGFFISNYYVTVG